MPKSAKAGVSYEDGNVEEPNPPVPVHAMVRPGEGDVRFFQSKKFSDLSDDDEVVIYANREEDDRDEETEEESSPGNSSSASGNETTSDEQKKNESGQSPARETDNRSSRDQGASSTVRSTGGPQKPLARKQR